MEKLKFKREILMTEVEVVEKQATPIGGMNAFLQGVGKSIDVGNPIKETDVEGNVYVPFVVGDDGKTKISSNQRYTP